MLVLPDGEYGSGEMDERGRARNGRLGKRGNYEMGRDRWDFPDGNVDLQEAEYLMGQCVNGSERTSV